MPRLWSETIAAHRHDVREAILDATATLVAGEGLLSVTMSEIAERTGIARATLYKYFPDVEAILLAWHERQVDRHLAHLRGLGERAADARDRLRSVLESYAVIVHESRGHADTPLGALLHGHLRVAHADERLHELVERLLEDAVAAGHVRDDVPPRELARYCLHALRAAATLPSRAAVLRLAEVTLAGLAHVQRS